VHAEEGQGRYSRGNSPAAIATLLVYFADPVPVAA